MTGRLLAHGVGGRQDLPIPFAYAVTGAAVALLVSFLALGLLWREPRLLGDVGGRPLPMPVQRVVDSPVLRWALRGLGLVVAGYVLLGAVAGPDLATNPTAGVVYVLLWVGLVPASLLLGPVWRLVNPLRTLHLLLARALRTDPDVGAAALPPRLGYWPAAVGLLAFVWLELAAPERTSLAALRGWFAAYAAVQLVAAAVYGARWFDRGDAFEVYSALIGRLAPVGRRADGRLVLRWPLDGLAGLRREPGLVAVIAVLLGSTAYDGLSTDARWFTVVQSGVAPPVVLETLGLLATVALVALTYTLATLLAGRLGEVRRSALPGVFAHSLVPIVVGYLVAHYYSLLVLEGQRTLIQLSDPLGSGADWLGTAERGVDSSLVTPTGVATLQVVAVVTGHVLGVVAAHDRAVARFPPRQALAGQVPLLLVMVGYTVSGLLLLFSE